MKFVVVALLSISSVWALVPIDQIPRTSYGTRIVGGAAATASQFPYQAAIYTDTASGRYFCGGALITDQFILTAAQCVYQATLFTIHLGSTLLQGTDANRLILSTSTYFIHEGYNPETLADDIGLIKLHMPVAFTDYIQSIEIAPMGHLFHMDQIMSATGWGQISDESSALTSVLNYVDVTIMSDIACQASYGGQITKNMICAEGNYNEGICFGDIGGPVVIPAVIGPSLVHVAISSFISMNGCESLDPSGFTKTGAYNAWINNITNNN